MTARKQKTELTLHSNISNLDMGKVPPQAVNFEEAVLGAILLERDAILPIEHFFNPKVFYKTAHVIIAEAVKEMRVKGTEIDLLTFTEYLKTKNQLDEVGGPYYLVQLTNKIASAVNIETHYRTILQKFIGREVIRCGGNLYQKGFNDDTDVFDLLDESINTLEKIREGISQTGEKDIYNAISDFTANLQEKQKHHLEGKPSGIPTPVTKLTNDLRGWQPTDLIVIAARPGMGKTAFALECARVACEADFNAAFFSLEMSELQLLGRLLQGFGMTESELKDGNMSEESWSNYSNHIATIYDWKLYIDDTGGVDVNYIKSVCQRLKKQKGLDIVFIDYLQLMSLSDSKSTTDEKVGEVTRALKAMAKNLKVTVVVLSQLNRDVEKRADKIPQLSDLRSSGNIEQDADIVIFPFRPAYYGFDYIEEVGNTKDYLQLIVAKNRHAQLFKYKARHNDSITRIFDFEENISRSDYYDF